MASTLAPLAAVWAGSSLVASPALVFSTTSPYRGGEATGCVLEWPDGPPSTSLMDHVYQVPHLEVITDYMTSCPGQVVFLLVTYVLPLAGLGLTYTHLTRLMWRLQWTSDLGSDRQCLAL